MRDSTHRTAPRRKEDRAKQLLKYKWTLPFDVLPGSSSSRFPVSNTPDSNEDYSPPPPNETDYFDFTDSKVLEKPPSEEGSRSHASITLFATSRALAGPNSWCTRRKSNPGHIPLLKVSAPC
jgi:hypothetical protein